MLFLSVRHTPTDAFPQIFCSGSAREQRLGGARRGGGRVSIAGAVVAILVAGGCGGCSIVVPVNAPEESSVALWRGDPADVTGAIPGKTGKTLSRALTAEDSRRAAAAMSTALDPQGDGGVVNWDNPHSGARGSFTPAGQPYPRDGKICRAFRAEVATPDHREEIRGAACRDKSAEWSLTEVKADRKG